MESRKIQKVGTSTLTVSLPKEWVKKHALDKGDSIYVSEEVDGLKLMPGEAAKEKLQRLVDEYIIQSDLCDQDKMLERLIVGNYVLGRERLQVVSEKRMTPEHIQEVRRAVQRLMGLGIIEETTHRMLLQCSIEPVKYPIYPLLKRLYMIGTTMIREAMEGLESWDASTADNALAREDDADRIYWLTLRLLLSAQQNPPMIQQLGMENNFENVGNRLVAKDLESIADLGEEIARNVRELIVEKVKVPPKILKAFKDFSDEILDVNEEAVASLLTRDLRLANRVINRGKSLVERERRLVRLMFESTRDGHAILLLRNILDALVTVGNYGFSIAVVAINRYLERPSTICKVNEKKPNLR